MDTILITGGTGMIGRALAKVLIEKNYRVIILTRDPSSHEAIAGLSYAAWDIGAQTIDKDAIATADHIIHLAGAGVADKRWSKKRKKEIVDSRLKSGELLVKALKEYPNKVRTVVSASAIGWYGPDPIIPNPRPFSEEDPASDDFLGSACKTWEDSLAPTEKMGKRLVRLRTGIVLSREGGALEEFRKPLKFGIATILGKGNQMISWINIDDLVRFYITAIEDEKLNGVYNAVAPQPVSNKNLVLQLAKAMRGKFYIPIYVPAFVLKMVLGEMSIEVLKSATVSCSKAHLAGFVFLYPSIESNSSIW